MKILVDADACPVKEIIIEEARQVDLTVVLVKSISHFSHNDELPGVETIYVDTGSDAADYRIMKLAERNDIIVTQDYGLAALGLGKKCKVLHHTGFAYSNKNIDQLLQSRHVSAKARRSGQKTKGPKALTNEDREKFRSLLKNYIQNKHD